MKSVISHLQERHKSSEEADFLSSLFQQYRDDVVYRQRQVCLFGAGSAGKELAECLVAHGIEPTFFCTSYNSGVDCEILGIPVISFEEAKLCADRLVFVVASNDHKEEIKQTLIDSAIPHWCSLDDKAQLFYYLQIYKWYHPLSVLDADKVQHAYELLEDKQSRNIYTSRINLVTSYADYGSFNKFISEYGLCAHHPISTDFKPSIYTPNYESYLYFNNDVLTLADGEVLLDAGAFDGDSALEFIKACERQNLNYQELICIEADAQNYKKLLSNNELPKETVCIQRGLWSESTTLTFASSSETFITESRIISEELGSSKHGQTYQDTTIQTMTIDELAINHKVSFIKMDIEGAELKALEGARKTLQEYQPKLAISLYHRNTDIYEIPLLIKEICPEYKFYIRHLSENLCETVLLAMT